MSTDRIGFQAHVHPLELAAGALAATAPVHGSLVDLLSDPAVRSVLGMLAVAIGRELLAWWRARTAAKVTPEVAPK